MSRGMMAATAATVLALGVAAIAIGALMQAKLEVARLQDALAEAERNTEAKRELTAARTRMSALEAELDRLRAEATPRTAEAPTAMPQGAPGDASGPSALEVLAQLGAGAGAPDAAEPGEAEANPLAALGDLLQGEGMEQAMETSVLAQVSMMYGDFLRGDALTPEKREALRELLNAHAKAQMRDGLDVFTGKAEWDEVQAYLQEAQAQRDAEIAALLSPTELEAWEAYEAELPQRMMTQSIDMQLGMFAPGLSSETRDRARDVIVEEMLMSREADPSTTIPGGVQAMSQAMANARERLAGEIGEEDLQQLDLFMQQMEQFAQIGEGMMGPGVGLTQP